MHHNLSSFFCFFLPLTYIDTCILIYIYYAYLAFLYLYNLNPGAAKIALKSALEIDPHQPEIRSLNGIAALMQGNLVQAWQELKVGQ